MFTKLVPLPIFVLLTASSCFAQCFKDEKLYFSISDAAGIAQTFTQGYCLDNDSQVLSALACDLGKKCLALKPRKLPRSLLSAGNTGTNPAFQYCSDFHGKAVSVRYLKGKKWIDSPVCVFPDQSFVSLDFFVRDLLSFY